MGQTVFRSPVPWTRSGDHGFLPESSRHVQGPHHRREEGRADSVAGRATQSQVGIRVANPWAADSGPGIIERVEVRNMLKAGIAISGGSHWIVRNSKIHDNGCSNRLPCPNLRIIDPGAKLHNPTLAIRRIRHRRSKRATPPSTTTRSGTSTRSGSRRTPRYLLPYSQRHERLPFPPQLRAPRGHGNRVERGQGRLDREQHRHVFARARCVLRRAGRRPRVPRQFDLR